MFRKLSAETLEARQLLAANASMADDCQSAEIASFVAGTSTTSSVVATDAGASPATAANIGSLDGTTRLSGTLGWLDRADTIGFSVERDAELTIDLSGLNRDADLYLTDESGNVIGRSNQRGRGTESLSGSVTAGQYYVTVVSRSFSWTRYDLTLSAQLESESENTAENPVITAPSPGGATPLADVAYFGGSREWSLNAIGAPEAWAAGYTGQGITVAVVDTGVDLDHPDLVSNLYVNAGEIAGNGIDDDRNGLIDDVSGYDFADRDAVPNDVSGHGTHVAGTIAASNNSFGATGVAPDAKILPVRVLGANGSGSTLDVAAGIRYAADLGADIINLSLGGGYSRAIDAAIDYARSLGSFIVAAAGNESSFTPAYPARFSATDSNVISVGATDSSNRLASFSNDVGGSGSIQVDAPGVGIFSTYTGGEYGTLSGTSMAAPHVAGLAALTLSANPDLTSPELRELLASGLDSRASGSDAIGSIDARTTVALAVAGFTSGGALFANPTATTLSSGIVAASARIRATAVADSDQSSSTYRRDSSVPTHDRFDHFFENNAAKLASFFGFSDSSVDHHRQGDLEIATSEYDPLLELDSMTLETA